jgi:hypothetical protein
MVAADERKATDELLGQLRANRTGLRTSQMIGTRRLHGMRALGPRQVARLLRASGVAEEQVGGQDTQDYTVCKQA